MKKIIYLALFIAPVAIGQTTDYTLSQAVSVGCSSGVADLGKKITVEKTDASAKFTLTNMACSKSYDGSLKVDFGSGATGYFDGKEKKGIVIDGQEISLFNNDGSKYQVVIAGHQDKKLAKTIATEAQQAKYQKVFDGFDALLINAKKEADMAKMAANTLPVPNLNLQDEYGVSGLYYFSELVSISSSNREIDGKSVKAVYMHIDKADNYTLKVYLNETKYDKYFFDGPRMFKAFKNGSKSSLGLMKPDNMNDIKVMRSSISQLEDGLFMVDYWYWFATKSGCSVPERRGGTQAELDAQTKRYILLGKDQKRIEHLLNNPSELEALAGEKAVSFCKYSDALEAAEKPMPVASPLNTGTLKTEATALTKAWAQGRWAQEVQYSFIIGKEWNILRNNLGVIIGRNIAGIAVMKDKDGTCRWEEIALRQDYNGTAYGKTYFSWESTLIIPVDCSTAMKYK